VTANTPFAAAFRQALADPSIGGIVISVDSPGGSVYGVPELVAEIYRARGQKPVVAVADSMAASAAYWIACQAEQVYVTPGGEVGSIGVLTAHADMSQALANEGVSVSVISAGRYKAEASPYAPLTDEARAAIQARVDEY
jgi:signal peptide peptidase SppA